MLMGIDNDINMLKALEDAWNDNRDGFDIKCDTLGDPK